MLATRHFLNGWRPTKMVGLVAGLFLVLGLAVYGPLLRSEFIMLDDGLLIYENPAVQSLSWQTLRTIFTTYDPELYIPLTLLSYQIDFAIGGINPFVYHLHSLLLHVLTACIFSLILVELRIRRDVACGVGLLFLLHPLHGEAVLWASARKDVLSALFFALSMWSYLRFRQEAGRRWYVASLVAFMLGLLAKVSIIPLPLVLLLIDDLHGRRWDKRMMMEKLPFFLIALLFGFIAVLGKPGAAQAASLGDLLLISSRSVVFLFQKFFLPWNLSIFYPLEGSISLLRPVFLFSACVLILLLVITFVLRRRSRVPFFAFTFFLLMVAPSFLNLIKDGITYLGSDRYAYAASFGLLFAIGWSIQLLSFRVRVALLSVLILTSGVVAGYNARFWRSNETLYRHVLSLYPSSSAAHISLADVLRRAGNADEALAEYDQAIAINAHPAAYYNKGVLLETLGKREEAERAYRSALERRPSYALAWVNLGKLLYEQDKKQEALVAFQEAAVHAPRLANAHFNLGVLYGEAGDYAAAESAYRSALAADSLFVDARVNLVGVLLGLGRKEDALEEVRVLVRDTPDHPHVKQLLSFLYDKGIVIPN